MDSTRNDKIGQLGDPLAPLLGKYIISTQNTDYEVQMSHDHARHLALEVGASLTPLS